ncbi:MAG: purine-nucleoside phosphorylase [Bdellovibrionales bacterium]|nr:purine-nucleoside phosphorylase [Bdellovibrionales bacterium]
MSETLEQLAQAVDYIESKTTIVPRVGVTLGSGLASFAEEVKVDCSIDFSEIPHFAPSKVKGHPGKLLVGELSGVPLAVLQGRIHFYEGHSMQQVIFPTRVLARWGVRHQIITNAAGGVDPKMSPGELMILRDQINLTGTNPLIGLNDEELGPRFPDMSEPFCKSSIESLKQIMQKNSVPHSTGVYCGVTGPSYETAAEVRYLHQIGGHAVGMSTVPEVIAARHMGVKVSGISCVTNLGTGLSDEVLDHADVQAVAKRVEADFRKVLVEFVSGL